jgi:predicted dienelactone hydrolase
MPPPSAQTPYPLIIFSHGFHGNPKQSRFLTLALSQHGYLVFAPEHRDAGLNGASLRDKLGRPDTWSDSSSRDRAEDVDKVLDALKSDQKWKAVINWNEVGLAGHSLGGYTVLGLSGAWASWKRPEVKAVLALSPYAQPFIVHQTLSGVHVPVMYQGGTLDLGITPSIAKNRGAFDQTSSPAYFVNLNGAGHFAFTDLNPRFQPSVTAYSLAFFDRYLLGKDSPLLSKKLDDVTELLRK